jgi:hypothetical protein
MACRITSGQLLQLQVQIQHKEEAQKEKFSVFTLEMVLSTEISNYRMKL